MMFVDQAARSCPSPRLYEDRDRSHVSVTIDRREAESTDTKNHKKLYIFGLSQKRFCESSFRSIASKA